MGLSQLQTTNKTAETAPLVAMRAGSLAILGVKAGDEPVVVLVEVRAAT